MFACRIPANINRKSFAFEKWNDWDETLFELIKTSLLKKVTNPNIQIKGSDKAPSAIEKTAQNIENANLSDFISLEKKNFFQLEKETKGPLHLLTNPPYGERLEGDMNALYQGIGDAFKQSFPNTHAWMISSNMEAIKCVGLRPSRKIRLFNGKLESRLLYYPIYEGTKRIHKLKKED
jgi:putative N6-adenine-specific DNA methylase